MFLGTKRKANVGGGFRVFVHCLVISQRNRTDSYMKLQKCKYELPPFWFFLFVLLQKENMHFPSGSQK